jgi:hypothetical protein
MSSFKDRSDYFKLICAKNKLIAHNAIIVGADNPRCSFFRVNDEEELNAACVNWIHFPCVVHTGHNINFKQPGTGLPRMAIGNHLVFLTKLDRDTYTYDADAIEAAYDEALTAMNQFVSYMLNDMEENESCGNMFLFDLSKAKAEQIGPINQVLYGWYLQFYDEEKAREMIYDDTKWDLEAGGDGGGGSGSGGGEQYDLQNFTDVEYSESISGGTFIFSGGNLIGETEIQTSLWGPNYTARIAEGITTGTYSFNLGTHTVKWRRKKGNQYSEWSENVSFTVVNTGQFTFSLVDAVTLNENDVQFPVNVALVTNITGGLDSKSNSNQIANDEDEFIAIWNAINGDYCEIISANYHIYTSSFKRWEFTANAKDNKQRPSAAWCYAI